MLIASHLLLSGEQGPHPRSSELSCGTWHSWIVAPSNVLLFFFVGRTPSPLHPPSTPLVVYSQALGWLSFLSINADIPQAGPQPSLILPFCGFSAYSVLMTCSLVLTSTTPLAGALGLPDISSPQACPKDPSSSTSYLHSTFSSKCPVARNDWTTHTVCHPNTWTSPTLFLFS